MPRCFQRAGLLSLLTVLSASPRLAEARPRDPEGQTLLEFLKSRTDIPKNERGRWEAEVKKRFGGAALKNESDENQEIAVAKSILASAIFLEVDPAKAALGAFEGYRGALGYVPPPIAIHYQVLVFQGRPPRGRPIDLAFNFPKYYNDEIAPDLVAYWEEGLKNGKIPDFALEETKEALAETRVKMRPLLLDKLRLEARLARELAVAKGARRAEIESDLREVELELARSFSGVARRPEVLDGRKRPYDRLRIQLEDMGVRPTEEDRLLDPDAPPPPRHAPTIQDPNQRPVEEPSPTPTPSPTASVKPTARPTPTPAPLVEPTDLPRNPPPPQPRPGDPNPYLDPMVPSQLKELVERYRSHLTATIVPWLGTPYLWGGDLRGAGTDCSGFTRGVFRDGFEVELPRVSRDQFRYGRSVPRNELQPGDLVFFDTANSGHVTHVGVYAGNGQFAHASTGKGVVYADLEARWCKDVFRGARRVLAYPAPGMR